MAISFQVGGRYIRIASYPVSGIHNITMMGWAFLPSAPSQSQGLCLLNGSDPSTSVGIDTNGLAFNSSSSTSNVYGPMPPTKQWFHYAVTHWSDTDSNHILRGYLNGRQIVTQIDTTQYFGANVPLALPHVNFQTIGYERDFRTWRRVLTDTEIALEYVSDIPVHNQGLMLWSPFDNDTYKNKGGLSTKWATVGGAAVLVGLGGTNQIKRNNRRFK